MFAGLALALLVPVIVLAGCAQAPAGTAPVVNVGSQQEGIWVNGRGEVQAVPDIATLNLGVQAQAASVAEAQAQAQAAMEKVMTALKSLGVAEKDIQTTGYSIWQQTRWDQNKQEEIVTGYQVSNNIQAKVRDVETTGAVLDAAVQAGGDYIRVNGIQFEVDDPSQFLADARTKAVADAKAKAAQLADLAGVKLGSPTYITESYDVPVVYPRSYAMMDSAEAAGATPVSAGETTIVATVQIVFEIA
jgi:uncharacterized protein YggE